MLLFEHPNVSPLEVEERLTEPSSEFKIGDAPEVLSFFLWTEFLSAVRYPGIARLSFSIDCFVLSNYLVPVRDWPNSGTSRQGE